MEPSVLSWWETGLAGLWTIFTDTLDTLTGNPFFAIILVSALVVIAFKLIKKAKKASK